MEVQKLKGKLIDGFITLAFYTSIAGAIIILFLISGNITVFLIKRFGGWV